MVEKNTWVQIHRIVLSKEQRASNLPEETKQVPLELWVKGFLLTEGEIGDTVKIKTITGRIEEGTLVAINPSYKHNYGDFVREILEINRIVKETLGDDYE